MSYTKGEWKVNQSQTGPTTLVGFPFAGGANWYYETVNAGQETIAVCPNQAQTRIVGQKSVQIPGSGLANARLIAAAPDMYKAIKIAMSRHRVYSGNLEIPIEALYAFEKALAKAEAK